MLGEDGQPLSKNEQKRRIKELEKAKKAAEKPATKAAEPAKQEKPTDSGPALEEEDEDMDPTKVGGWWWSAVEQGAAPSGLCRSRLLS